LFLGKRVSVEPTDDLLLERIQRATGLITDAPAGHPTVRQLRDQGVTPIQE
jgi:hypothetical protein